MRITLPTFLILPAWTLLLCSGPTPEGDSARQSKFYVASGGDCTSSKQCELLGAKTKRHILCFQGLSHGTPPTAGPHLKRPLLDLLPPCQYLSAPSFIDVNGLHIVERLMIPRMVIVLDEPSDLLL